MNFKNIIADFIKDEEGLTVVEYAIAGGLVSAGVIASFGTLGEKVDGVISFLGEKINTPAG